MHIYHIRLLVYFWFTTMLIFATWCNWRDFYWCWIKFCLSLSLSLNYIIQHNCCTFWFDRILIHNNEIFIQNITRCSLWELLDLKSPPFFIPIHRPCCLQRYPPWWNYRRGMVTTRAIETVNGHSHWGQDKMQTILNITSPQLNQLDHFQNSNIT